MTKRITSWRMKTRFLRNEGSVRGVSALPVSPPMNLWYQFRLRSLFPSGNLPTKSDVELCWEFLWKMESMRTLLGYWNEETVCSVDIAQFTVSFRLPIEKGMRLTITIAYELLWQPKVLPSHPTPISCLRCPDLSSPSKKKGPSEKRPKKRKEMHMKYAGKNLEFIGFENSSHWVSTERSQ